MTSAKAVAMSVLHDAVRQEPFAELSRFRDEFYSCLTRRADALFELADAVLCTDGPVRSLVELSLVGEHRRGHGGLYDALAAGRVDFARMRRAVAAVPLPRAAGGRLVLAADITCWLRPSAPTSPQRILCHTYGRGKDHIPVPGWPCSVICALETGRSSWTAPLDALRLAPGDDAATVTARQMRELVERLMTAGQWRDGDPDIWIVVDAATSSSESSSQRGLAADDHEEPAPPVVAQCRLRTRAECAHPGFGAHWWRSVLSPLAAHHRRRQYTVQPNRGSLASDLWALGTCAGVCRLLGTAQA